MPRGQSDGHGPRGSARHPFEPCGVKGPFEFPPCWRIRSRPIDYFSANGVPATGSRALFQSLLHDLYFLQIRTFAIQHLPWFVCLVGSNLHSVDPTLRFGAHRVLRHCFSGDPQSILRGLYFVPFKCGVLVTAWICWRCHRQILPEIITTVRSGVNSVWATVFGRLLSIACGNIVPFKVREQAFAGSLSICSRAESFDPQIRFFSLIRSDSCTVRICFELFRELLSLYNSSFSAQVPCILVCKLCVRLSTCGFLVLSAALEPLVGSLTLVSLRQISRIHPRLIPCSNGGFC